MFMQCDLRCEEKVQIQLRDGKEDSEAEINLLTLWSATNGKALNAGASLATPVHCGILLSVLFFFSPPPPSPLLLLHPFVPSSHGCL